MVAACSNGRNRLGRAGGVDGGVGDGVGDEVGGGGWRVAVPAIRDAGHSGRRAKQRLVRHLSPKTPDRRARRRKAAFAASVTALLLVTGLSALYILPRNGFVPPNVEPVHDGGGHAVFDANQTVAAAIAEMQAIADATASAVAQAGAAADAEFNASLDAASQSAASAAAEAESAVAAAGNAGGNLTEAPEGYVEGGSVQVVVDDVSESEFQNGSYQYEYTFHAPGEGGDYQNSSSSFEARGGLNLPASGVAQVDTTLAAAVDAYLTYKTQLMEGIVAENNVSVLLGEDYHYVSGAEGYSYYEAPDKEGAEAALAHANATIEAAFRAAGNARAAVNASWSIELTLVAETEAQIEAAADAAAQAKADVSAEAEAKADAQFAAAFDKEAELHAEAEHKIDEAHKVHKGAKAQVQAETQGQVEAMYGAAATAEEQFTARAQDALAAGAEAEEAIWAAADAQVAALLKAGSDAGVNVSGEVEAIMSVAAEQASRARFSAQYMHDLMVRQAANARVNADARASAMWDAAASADARLDAQLEVSVKLILRAEAYAVARVHAEAEARAQAYFATAQRLSAQIDQRYHAEVQALIRAAFSVHFASQGNLDSSRDLAELVRQDMNVEVAKDVSYMRTVASDYERREALPEYAGEADYWYDLASAVETDGAGVTQYVDLVLLPEIEEKSQTFVGVQRDLTALQEKWA